MGWTEYLLNYPDLAFRYDTIDSLIEDYNNFGSKSNKVFDKIITNYNFDDFKKDNDLDDLSIEDVLKYYLYFTENIKNDLALYKVNSLNDKAENNIKKLLITCSENLMEIDYPKELNINYSKEEFDCWCLRGKTKEWLINNIINCKDKYDFVIVDFSISNYILEYLTNNIDYILNESSRCLILTLGYNHVEKLIYLSSLPNNLRESITLTFENSEQLLLLAQNCSELVQNKTPINYDQILTNLLKKSFNIETIGPLQQLKSGIPGDFITKFNFAMASIALLEGTVYAINLSRGNPINFESQQINTIPEFKLTGIMETMFINQNVTTKTGKKIYGIINQNLLNIYKVITDSNLTIYYKKKVGLFLVISESNHNLIEVDEDWQPDQNSIWAVAVILTSKGEIDNELINFDKLITC